MKSHSFCENFKSTSTAASDKTSADVKFCLVGPSTVSYPDYVETDLGPNKYHLNLKLFGDVLMCFILTQIGHREVGQECKHAACWFKKIVPKIPQNRCHRTG